MFVSGFVDGLNDVVYSAVPFTTLRFDIFPSQALVDEPSE